MRRRLLLGAAAQAPWSLAARAQGRAKVGVLVPSPAQFDIRPLLENFRNVGFVEGRNLLIEMRSADGDFGRLPRLAKELVDAGVDAIVAVNTPARAPR